LTAQLGGNAEAVLAQLPALRAHEERHTEAKLIAADLLAAAGCTDDAVRLRREVAETFAPSGRVALLRHRATAT
jgi:hypothetical protein